MPQLETVLVAYRRGWSVAKIAAAAGISKQAIDQQLRRAAKRGLVDIEKGGKGHSKLQKGLGPIVFNSYCSQCGRRFEQTNKNRWIYCSRTCAKINRRKVHEKDADSIIAMRKAGQTWLHIQRLLGVSYQTIACRIWITLYERNRLTVEIINEIWPEDGIGRHGRVNWLIRRTGLSPKGKTIKSHRQHGTAKQRAQWSKTYLSRFNALNKRGESFVLK